MNTTFPRTLTLLRKERGISQKQAAAELKISQALLSHYEKGIRECGLDFVVRAADFYEVSCDYLLGRTVDKSGAVISVDDIPEGDPNATDSHMTGSVLPVLNKKLVVNATNLLFGLLQRYDNKELTTEVTTYLNLAIYTMFRALYAADKRNSAAMLSVPAELYQPATAGAMSLCAARVGMLAPSAPPKEQVPALLPSELSKVYPLFASSLMNLLKNAENKLGKIQ
ncbi:MAG: helix-turn-helix transcriptional regulator [Clostridia bacterium]|nr:helix-turn-helix transcriptional regulator [Clostridia bacterium]